MYVNSLIEILYVVAEYKTFKEYDLNEKDNHATICLSFVYIEWIDLTASQLQRYNRMTMSMSQRKWMEVFFFGSIKSLLILSFCVFMVCLSSHPRSRPESDRSCCDRKRSTKRKTMSSICIQILFFYSSINLMATF